MELHCAFLEEYGRALSVFPLEITETRSSLSSVRSVYHIPRRFLETGNLPQI